MKSLAAAFAISISTLLCLPVSPAFGEGLSEETGKEILNELKQIRTLLQSQPRAAQPAPEQAAIVRVGPGGAALGRPDAPVTIVEFTDYQCPFCRRFYGSAFPSLKKNYIDTGKVRFVSRNLPLPIHPDARNAARAVICAGEQGRYWEMRDALFLSGDLGIARLPDYASNVGIDARQFQACLATDQNAKIESDVSEANAIGVTGTPSFVIGRTSTGEMTGERVVGALPFGVFETKINALLEKIAAGDKAR